MVNMQKNSNKAAWVLIGGIVGIIGVLLTILSDFILIGKPTSAYGFLKLGTESMVNLAEWRITVGTFLGVFVLPMQIAGLITVYYGLKPASKGLSLAVAITTAHLLIMGVAFHTSYAFIGSGWKLNFDLASENAIVLEMLNKFNYYWKIIIYIMLIELLVISIFFTVMILKGKTLYPKWMSLLNPLCISIYLFPIVLVLPAPVGGFIAPAFLNIITLIFMTLSLVIIIKKCK